MQVGEKCFLARAEATEIFEEKQKRRDAKRHPFSFWQVAPKKISSQSSQIHFPEGLFLGVKIYVNVLFV